MPRNTHIPETSNFLMLKLKFLVCIIIHALRIDQKMGVIRFACMMFDEILSDGVVVSACNFLCNAVGLVFHRNGVGLLGCLSIR